VAAPAKAATPHNDLPPEGGKGRKGRDPYEGGKAAAMQRDAEYARYIEEQQRKAASEERRRRSQPPARSVNAIPLPHGTGAYQAHPAQQQAATDDDERTRNRDEAISAMLEEQAKLGNRDTRMARQAKETETTPAAPQSADNGWGGHNNSGWGSSGWGKWQESARRTLQPQAREDDRRREPPSREDTLAEQTSDWRQQQQSSAGQQQLSEQQLKEIRARGDSIYNQKGIPEYQLSQRETLRQQRDLEHRLGVLRNVIPDNEQQQTRAMWHEGYEARCPLAVHIAYVDRNSTIARKELRKFSINTISTKAEYRAWIHQLNGELFAAGLKELVDELVAKPQDYLRTKNGKCYGPLYYYNKMEPNNPNFGEMTVKMIASFSAIQSMVMSSLREKAQEYILGENAKDLISILRVLSDRWGEISTVEQFHLMNDFWQVRWDPAKGCLEDWISSKFAITVKVPELMPSQHVVNHNMLQIMLNNLPSSFKEITASIRSSGPVDWHEAKKKLIDYEQALAYDNNEPAGQTNTVDGEVNWLNKGKGKGQGKGGKGNSFTGCHICFEPDHWSYSCPNKPNKQYNNYNNNKGKGQGKGGAKGGKGKKKWQGPNNKNKNDPAWWNNSNNGNGTTQDQRNAKNQKKHQNRKINLIRQKMESDMLKRLHPILVA
jgi:hypothetical protein